MTSPNGKLSLEEVLDQFFFSADKPSPNIVLSACQAYPEYREEILEFFALWSSYEATPENASIGAISDISEESVSRLQSFVLNTVHNLDTKPVTDADVEAAKLAISDLAGAKFKRASAAAGLGESSLLLTKILTRRITNTPINILKNLAHHLKVTETALNICLGENLSGGMSYKSSVKPIISQSESWESAVMSLSVSTEEKNRLLSLQMEDYSL